MARGGKSPATSVGTSHLGQARYSDKYNEEFKEIFQLAARGYWDEAETRISALYESDPNDSSVQRVRSWINKQRELLRDQALEDRIREIESRESVFNPTVKDLAVENKDRGLPPRKDLRDAVQDIQSTPYIPETYGTVQRRIGNLQNWTRKEGRMAAVLDRKISIHLDNVPLETIIFDIGQAEGINFVADKSLPAFQTKLSMNLDSVPLKEFLDYLSRNMKLQFQVGDDLIWIVDGSKPEMLYEETRFYHLKHGFIMPAAFGASEVKRTKTDNKGVVTIQETETIDNFVRDGAPKTPFIEEAIKKFFKGSDYLIDYERNVVSATGTREQLEQLERIIEVFDRPVQQVLIEARFVTVTEAAFMQLGASWETGRGTLQGTRNSTDFTSLARDFGVGLGLQETFGNILNRDNLSITLTALEQSGESQTLSAPRLTLVNNLPATINDGKVQYYYEEYTVSQQVTDRATASSLVPSGKPTEINSGVSLDVLASIGGDGKTILLALRPKVNQEVELVTFASVKDIDPNGNVISSFDIRLPEARTQELSTRVLVRSGETVVMGGVLEREQLTLVESVPVLGNIPIIGAAFRKRTEVDKPRYLLVFVTATLLGENGEFIIYEDEPTGP